MKIVLYDYRKNSPTYKQFNEIYLGEERPGLISFPPMIFHAVQNIGDNDAAFLAYSSEVFDYENPDRFRLPPSSKDIPYDFSLESIGK
jgi:dTDP-4-dehydrorhamnose 3,5-epimerase